MLIATRRKAVVLFAAACMLVVGAEPAAAEDWMFEFEGSGWGHGVGMSQYGALSMAEDGHGHATILAHYYQGSSLGDVPSSVRSDIDVGLLQDQDDVGFTPRDGSATLAHDGDEATAEAGETWRFRADGDGECRFEGPDDEATDAGPCEAEITWDGSTIVGVEERDQDYARGALGLRADGDAFHVVATVDLEEYLYGIAEVPFHWPMEALKAQVIAARGYAAYPLIRGDGADGCACDVYDTQASQVYEGHQPETAHNFDRWKAAVDDTADTVVTHPDGEDGVAQAFYFSSSGGRTANSEDVFVVQRGYLRSVDDAGSWHSGNRHRSWTADVPRSDLASAFGLDEVREIAIAARNESGSVASVEVTGVDGGSEVTDTIAFDEGVRGDLGLRSRYLDAITPAFFVDVDDSVHFDQIAWIANRDITSGCNPPDNDRFCPERGVTRAEMATFLANAAGLSSGGDSGFTDVAADHTHADDIAAIADEGITSGCNPPDNDRYCPDRGVSRAEMATFLVNAAGLSSGGDSGFTDVAADHTHADDIAAIADEDITSGCNPPDNDRYCPSMTVTREQMATFLTNAFR